MDKAVRGTALSALPRLTSVLKINNNQTLRLVIVYIKKKLKIEDSELAVTYSPFKESTIGATKLNFRVRNGNGCTLGADPPTQNLQSFNFQISFCD